MIYLGTFQHNEVENYDYIDMGYFMIIIVDGSLYIINKPLENPKRNTNVYYTDGTN